ncbi:MAG TPA: hypothetical protein VH593_01210 [Ktedonobacteraceae bacterium]
MNIYTLQKFLLALGVVALIFLLAEIGFTLGATLHGSTPAHVDEITAGPYQFKVSLYDYPARAGLTLPFAIAPEGTTGGSWTYQVTSVPVGTENRRGVVVMSGPGNEDRTATPVKASVSPDPQVPGGVQGTAEITVQGQWYLQVIADGPSGQQTFNVPVPAQTLPAMPTWLGWSLGFIPVYGIIIFLVMQRARKERSMQSAIQGEEEQQVDRQGETDDSREAAIQ